MLGDRVLQGWSCLRGEGVYWSPRAALTKGHKLGPGGGGGGLRADTASVLEPGSLRPRSQHSPAPSEALGDDSS